MRVCDLVLVYQLSCAFHSHQVVSLLLGREADTSFARSSDITAEERLLVLAMKCDVMVDLADSFGE